ncbi:hypothetical protein JKP88DRAFT_201617 [Tribonema minus]|uniref:Uncharacterized protein n=1 Tax=Tribonema minus TaxID=303371 RepID=A0A835YRN9_9STRA|nr:hypothetical protein JKP88DRAFT_201617 [Tribonema minus]
MRVVFGERLSKYLPQLAALFFRRRRLSTSSSCNLDKQLPGNATGNATAAKPRVAHVAKKAKEPSKPPVRAPLVIRQVVILVSSYGGNPRHETEQRRCRDLFSGQGLVFEELDGANPENRDKRDFLFTLSNHKSYPQVFLESEGNIFKYVGTWPEIQEMLDSCDIPPEVLAKHPEIKTFDKVFGGVPTQAPSSTLSTVW